MVVYFAYMASGTAFMVHFGFGIPLAFSHNQHISADNFNHHAWESLDLLSGSPGHRQCVNRLVS